MGFIQPSDGSADVFVHRSALIDGNSLQVGSNVIFEPGWDEAKNKPATNKCGGAITLDPGVKPGGNVPLPNGVPGTVKAWIEGRAHYPGVHHQRKCRQVMNSIYNQNVTRTEHAPIWAHTH